MRELIDTHFHIWREGEVRRHGILAAPYLRRDVSWADFAAAWEGLPLVAAVNVQVNDFTDGTVEARWVAGASDPRRLGAIVAWAKLEDPGVEAELARLREIPAVRGVRRTCQYEADVTFCAQPDYVRGVRLLGRLGLVCDLCVRLGQVAAVPALARACPETTVVLEHLGKPDLSHPPDATWLAAVEELGRLPNVVAKLSVVVHRPDDPPLEAERVAPFLAHLRACLGPSRLMFGSNWPVSTAVIGYRPWVEMVRELMGDEEEIWAGTARRVYGLG
ncbi:MAG TPA: amidohydrolase family protein [Candidatus Dormibacteraeota bacterium]|nr:amidohydrolase family protein [Candidatus Dormibacteraeota bacterium]